MVVDDRYELLALHRALLEAKFVREPEDRDIAGSPFVAAIANRVVAQLSRSEPGWAEWRRAEKHPARVDVVKRRIREASKWASWSRQERATYVNILLSPLEASEALLDELVSIQVRRPTGRCSGRTPRSLRSLVRPPLNGSIVSQARTWRG